MSPLCRSFASNDTTVQFDIYGDGGWLLEVIDQFGNSTTWDDSFPSDQAALEEALDTIDQEGMESLIGLPSQSADQ